MLYMKYFSLLLVLVTFIPVITFSQSLESGIRLYQKGDYERALQVFDDFEEEPLANLFAGKSYFSLGQFLKAKSKLSLVDSTYLDLFQEARYTKALAEFQLKNYPDAIDILFEIKESPSKASIRRTAITFYFQLLNFLTLDQRYSAFKATKYDEVRLDLVKAAIAKVNYASAVTLWDSYKQLAGSLEEPQIQQIEQILSDSAAYMMRYDPNMYPDAPDGISYNIGVALPEFDVNSPNFAISQNLYYGIQLAIDEFNSNNADKKAFISFLNTKASAESAEQIINQFVWQKGVDVIIGPLFSEVASAYSKLAEEYEIPLVTPLANADHLNLDQNYTFQLNPTFSVHGRTMAQHAIQTLGYDTMAVIVERGSLGEPSAIAFRNEAIRNNVEIIKYYSENLEDQGYDITPFTVFIDPKTDTLTNYNIDAIYAPFTGQAATTLIGTLLTHLEAMRSDITLLGSEEWESVNLGDRNLPNSDLFYTKNYIATSDTVRNDNFESSYRLRFKTNPDFYSKIGYDAATLVLQTLKTVQNPAYMRDGLKNISNYQGLISKISFNNTHVNQHVQVVGNTR